MKYALNQLEKFKGDYDVQKRSLMFLTFFAALLLVVPAFAQDAALTIEPLGTYATGVFDEGAAEIVSYDAETQSLFIVNGGASTIDILNIADPANPTLTSQIDVTAYGGAANSVEVRDGIVAAAVEADPKTDPGSVVFFNTSGEFISQVGVGALPDMLIFTPDGAKVLTANEGEPSDDYSVDPEGSVSVIDISGGVENVTDENVTTLGFTDFNTEGSRAGELNADIRVYSPNATAAQDFEPEYIAVSPDNSTAFVTLQEANALAVIDLNTAVITEIRSFGFKDHSAEGNALDVSNEDGAINITNWPVLGMYQPDAIVAYQAGDTTYLVSANEGDTRDYDGYSEEGEVSEITLDPDTFPNAEELQQEGNLGKLELTVANGDTDGDGDFDAIYLPGGRSFSIWTLDGTLVFDSGDQLERTMAELYPDDFNATNDENGSFDDRSDNKGPEPEGIALGTIGDSTYAFIGLERISAIAVYDITDPAAPALVTWVSNRDFSGEPSEGTAGDLGPEGLIFISADESPNGENLLVVANEISGSTTVYQVSAN
jgi:DNA-binding beta-propeller fold protein YncE